MQERLNKLIEELAARKLDALVVTDMLNVRYLSGFTGSFGILVVGTEGTALFTDSRYQTQSCEQCRDIDIKVVDFNWPPHIQAHLNHIGAKRVGFEDGKLMYRQWRDLADLLGEGVLVPAGGLVEELRIVKDSDEIQAIREAARIIDVVYDEVLVRIQAGMRETDIALEMDYSIRRNGAEKEGFDTIVASGPRSAMPHGIASERVVQENDLIVFDYGARFAGYHSDITRTLVIGPASDKQNEIYSTVLEAQMRAIAAVAPGVIGKEVDAVARDYIASKGYGELFGHGLGHGLGLQVHDPGALNSRSEVVLEPGMIFTIEPGVYLPDWGGVRIEDDVLVTETGCEVLTHSPKVLSLA